MERLSGWDAMWLYSETSNVHTHTLKIGVFSAAGMPEPIDFGYFRRAVAGRLNLFEPLRYKLLDVPLRLHRPVWLKKCKIDLDYHLRRVRVASPGGRRELDALIGEIA